MRKPTNTEAPVFTVIVPCFNAANTIRDTVESVIDQDMASWELLVVDNGSTDRSCEIVQSLCARDSRIRLMHCARKGPSAARNMPALNEAKGKYLAFLDSDDLWTRNKLSVSLKHLEAGEGAEAVYGVISFFRISPAKPETYSTITAPQLTITELLRDNPVCTTSNLVISTQLFRSLGGFDEGIVHNEDVEFLVRTLASGARIAGIDQHLVSYRTSLTGLSTNLQHMREGWYKAIESLQRTSLRLSEKDLAAADAGNLRYLARRALRTNAPGFEALKFAWMGAVRSPRSFFGPFYRGACTLVGAALAPFFPQSIRVSLFSR